MDDYDFFARYSAPLARLNRCSWAFSAILSVSWLVAITQSKTILTDENGGEWAVGAGNGNYKPSSRIDPVLTNACPSQSYNTTGIRGNDIIYLKNAQTGTYAPNATIDLPRDRGDVEFTINLALVRRANANTVAFRTLITWVEDFHFHYNTLEHAAISSPCDIALHESTLRAGLNIAGRRDLPVGAIVQVAVMPSTGSDGLFVLNMTMPEVVSTDPAPSTSSTETTGPTITTPTASDSRSLATSSSASLPVSSSSSTTTSSGSSSVVDISQASDQPPQTRGTSTPIFPTEGSPSSNDGHPFPKSTVIAIAVAVVTASLVFAAVVACLMQQRRRRRRRAQYTGIASQSQSSPPGMTPISLSNEDDPLIAPFRLVQNTPGASLSAAMQERRTKEKPFPDTHAPVELPAASGSSSDSTSDYSDDAGEGEIVRAVRRVGLTTQALLRSLDRMVPESDAMDDGAGTLPPDYARIL
ncbi:hypothetical protein BKA62DRAFT_834051 [Auriculariales sp. MPI-PUGE-AT-0066]|nr:hypothetical protein BKA62DRAFT_834051 [Auriculariales sp. MPI-PUGE-AT-0066]